jgi:hypothetical protein
MTLRDDVKTVLDADAELVALLTGGIYDASDLEGSEITRQSAPDAFDANGEILPCALIRLGTNAQTGPYDASQRTSIRIFYYQRSGYDVIDQAIDLVRVDLDRKQIGSTIWEVRWSSNLRDMYDQALNCSMAQSTFYATHNG